MFRRDGRLISCHRFFSPLGALREWRAFLRFVRYGRRLLSPDEGRFPPDFLFVNIEKFYDSGAFDMNGARNCHHIYLTKFGALPFCIYNACVRGKPGGFPGTTGQ